MSDINDIFERLKGQKPVISNPDELTDFIMDSLPDISEATEPTGARVVKMRWWMAAAASLIIIIGYLVNEFNHTAWCLICRVFLWCVDCIMKVGDHCSVGLFLRFVFFSFYLSIYGYF